jgi:hypothetical protein
VAKQRFRTKRGPSAPLSRRVNESEWFTVRQARSKSMSAHAAPSISPFRRPLVRASTKSASEGSPATASMKRRAWSGVNARIGGGSPFTRTFERREEAAAGFARIRL